MREITKHGVTGYRYGCRCDSCRTEHFQKYLAWKPNRFKERQKETMCEICGKTIVGREINFDHNHKTGKFRGLLCGPCNMKIGWYESLEDWFLIYGDKAAEYLSRKGL